MRPNPLIIRAYLARGAYIWIAARISAGAMLALAGSNPIHFTFVVASLMVAVSTMLGVVESGRRHERALLENLAVSRTSFCILLAAPALFGELLMSLAASVRG